MQQKSKKIIVGCCGFPVSHKKYFNAFNCIEINITFYQLPGLDIATRWKQEAKSINKDFKFIIKAWQLITHPPSSFTYRRLKEKIPDNRKKYYGYFQPTDEVFNAWERTKEFANELGCDKILFQTPSSFKPNGTNMKNITTFFDSIGNKNKFTFIWEVRGNWNNNEIKEICKELNLIHCIDPLSPQLNKPVHGKFNYYRIHGSYEGKRINYNHKLNIYELNKIYNACDKEINYVMFNNSFMFDDASAFLSDIVGRSNFVPC
ncbi:DUF72 domain-containing protein [Melioribacteraceae bacterium 4301-Me]|uniref:DUF72 domain-containing protein n=1 Tax=Pyranulibacter aquaticus TaxID=3163344 RepID=UPI00359921CA